MTEMRVDVMLFARLRELAGTREERLLLPAPATVTDAWRAAVGTHPRLDGADRGVRVAVNETYASWSAPLSDGDVVAFIPPVAGGSGDAPTGVLGPGRPGVHVRLTDEVLDARDVEALVRTDGDGGVCTFTGVVRDNAEGHDVTHLEYEAYAGMAEAEMRRVGEEALASTGATAVALWHRVGALGVGEASVVIAASAPHRDTAFQACRLAIDTLKARVPIWKKEHGPGGAVWVDETQRHH